MGFQLIIPSNQQQTLTGRVLGIHVKERGADLGEVQVNRTNSGLVTNARVGKTWVLLNGSETSKGKRVRKPSWYYKAIEQALTLSKGGENEPV